MNEARYDHAVGIVTDEATQEKFVVVTGGTNLYTLNSTEILINGTFSIGKMYLFQEVEKPEMGFANHKYSHAHNCTSAWQNHFRFSTSWKRHFQ